MSAVAIKTSTSKTSAGTTHFEVLILGNEAEIGEFAAFFAAATSVRFALNPKKIRAYTTLMEYAEIKLVPDSKGLVLVSCEGTCLVFAGDSNALIKMAEFLESFLGADVGFHYHFDSDVNHDMLAPAPFEFVIEMDG